MNNPFSFVTKDKIKKQQSYTIHISSKKQYWKRFFSNKLNIVYFVVFLFLILSLLIALLFIKNSPQSSIDKETNLVNNLPSYLNPVVTRNFNRGVELDFIRQIANLEEKKAIASNREPIFVIYFDSAKEIGGNQTIYTDIVTLKYNPYSLISAINLLNKDTKQINIPSGLYLGTNSQGIDIFSRSVVTLVLTNLIIFIAIIINIFIGFHLGLIVNLYNKNLFINFIDKLITSISVIPEIIWVFLLSIFIGTQWYGLLASLSLVCFISYYKLSKEQIKELLTKDFILASKAVGASYLRIAYTHMFRYLLGNFLILLVERFSINILIVSSLAFLDFITDTNNLNIGSVLKEGIILFDENKSYLIIVSVYIILFSLSLKLLSTSLSKTLNPKLK